MMKKILAATVGAALIAPAGVMANDNFEISGNLRLAVFSHKLDRDGADSSSELRVDDQISDVTISGASDDLGGGMKAWFLIESRVTPDIGTSGALEGWGFGNQGVGLEGGFGKFTLGRWNLHYSEFLVLDGTASGGLGNWLSVGPISMVQGAPGTGIAGSTSALYIARGTRTDNLIKYDTPTLGGFTGTAAVSFNANGNEGSGVESATSDDPGKGEAINVAARWSGGPILAGVSYWDRKSEGDGSSALGTKGDSGDEQSTRAWFKYSFPFGLAAGVGYDQSGIRLGDGADMTERDAVLVALTFKTGANFFLARFAQMNESETGSTTNDESGATAWSLGYDRALSKRTFVGVSVSQIDNDENAAYNYYGGHLQAAGANTVSGTGATVGGDDVSLIALTMRHKF